LRKSIRPEFLNRIDETIVFTPLNHEEIKEIVRLQFNLIAERLKKSNHEISISEAAVDWVAASGFDPQFGARPIKRTLQRFVLNDLSKQLLAGTIAEDKPIMVDVENNTLVFMN
jgi:ATP-dependent Clp protease ATP-binding subunit ClpB